MGEAKTEDRDLYLAQEGTNGRADSIYLDQVERQQAEVLRAKAEGRPVETDLNKLPAAVGTSLVVKERLVDNSLFSNVTQDGTLPHRHPEPFTKTTVEVEPATPDVDLSYAAQVANERRAQEDSLSSETPADSVETSEGDTSTGLNSEGGQETTADSVAVADDSDYSATSTTTF